MDELLLSVSFRACDLVIGGLRIGSVEVVFVFFRTESSPGFVSESDKQISKSDSPSPSDDIFSGLFEFIEKFYVR